MSAPLLALIKPDEARYICGFVICAELSVLNQSTIDDAIAAVHVHRYVVVGISGWGVGY